ncbi:MAG TPA: hypothetical protein VFV38_52885 [Ktedonobacteraceae bacterium]|nr:hypothetical protein [Ktedonobacteraceae bacterium]
MQHPALLGRVGPDKQFLDIIYHSELGLDEHIETIYRENDMDPRTIHELPPAGQDTSTDSEKPGTNGQDTASRPETFVLFEQGITEERIIHDATRVELRRAEREQEALAQRYATYAASTTSPVPFAEFVKIMKMLSE